METKHTPGSWLAKHSESKDAFNVVGTQLGCNYKIARCPYLLIDGLPVNSEYNKTEAEANAKLIAAAPDLLKAAFKIQSEIETEGLLEESYDLLLLAIKKATE